MECNRCEVPQRKLPPPLAVIMRLMTRRGARFLLMVAALAGSLVYSAAAQGGPEIDSLTREMQGKTPDQIRALIVQRFGAPARDVGSGLQIEQWDVAGGVLTFHPIQGPTFEKDGVRTRLLRTTNPAALCLFGSYEMVTQPEGPYGLRYYLGNIVLSADRYRFIDSRSNEDHRKQQANNFFMLHPEGLARVKYSPGVTPATRLEDLPDNSSVGTVSFVTPDGRQRKTYRIVANRTSMSLSLEGKEEAFQVTKGWVNYWH